MISALEPCLEMQQMTTDDLDEVMGIEIIVCSFPWEYVNFKDSLDSGYTARVFRLESEMIGYFVIMQVVDEAHLLSISVTQKYQGKGFGSHLLGEVFNAARDLGTEQVLLEVRPSNEAGLALYKRFGFEQVGRRRDYYAAIGGREDALVLTCVVDKEVV